MPEFSEDQRIVIDAIAGKAAAEALRTSEEITRRVDERIGAKLPLVGKFERLFGHWQALAGVVFAVPLAGVGLNAMVGHMIDVRFEAKSAEFRDAVLQGLKPDIDATNAGLNRFRTGLAAQLETSVDSATTKLLRFGCNRQEGSSHASEAPGFPPCPTLEPEREATSNARNVLEAYEQTIVFKMNERQRALLRLRLNPVDGIPVLRNVGLRLSVPPLMSAGSTDSRDDIRLTAGDLADTDEFIEAESGLISLIGRVKSRSDQEPLFVEFDISKHLSRGTDVHALRLRADTLHQAPKFIPSQGSERFFVLATVIVTHRLERE